MALWTRRLVSIFGLGFGGLHSHGLPKHRRHFVHPFAIMRECFSIIGPKPKLAFGGATQGFHQLALNEWPDGIVIHDAEAIAKLPAGKPTG